MAIVPSDGVGSVVGERVVRGCGWVGGRTWRVGWGIGGRKDVPKSLRTPSPSVSTPIASGDIYPG